MAYGKLVNQYKRSNIETAGKLDLIIMCYERAIQLLTQIKGYIRGKEVEKKVYKFKKVLDIINELQGALDMEKGGEIARNLDSLYSYMTKRLLVGDIRKDESAYDEAIRILSELNEAWHSIQNEQEPRETAYGKRDLSETYNPRLTAF
ncbi:MAG: flagellar export chaperone FliS [Deltaproteobacteria bacterium]|nr:flagellar export chaperone FliS [Deltaproteobacteria bacterium]